MNNSATKILKRYAKESGTTVRSTSDLSPLEEWLLMEMCKAENLPVSDVRISLDGFPENMPLYKDSGLWQLRSDDMETVIYQQEVNQSDAEFLSDCKHLSES